MELFSKIYSCYYQVVGRILDEAAKHPIHTSTIALIASTYGYQESSLAILPKLVSGEWGLLQQEGKDQYVSRLNHSIKAPLTDLQKSWIKALLTDKRICLFLSDTELGQLEQELKDIKPLYYPDDFHLCDQYEYGDPYEHPPYRKFFQMFLTSIQEKSVLHLIYDSGKNKISELDMLPFRLQYSQKDDKFRSEGIRIVHGKPSNEITVNMGRIIDCLTSEIEISPCTDFDLLLNRQRAEEPVTIEISGERNSLERCMLHFASYEKQTEYMEERGLYLCSIFYDKQDETELLIQILSFGPVIRVTGPGRFLNLLKGRIRKQHELLTEPLF